MFGLSSLGSFSGGAGSGYSGGAATNGDLKTTTTTTNNNRSGGQYISAAPAWKGGVSMGGTQTIPSDTNSQSYFKYALLGGGVFVGIIALKQFKKK